MENAEALLPTRRWHMLSEDFIISDGEIDLIPGRRLTDQALSDLSIDSGALACTSLDLSFEECLDLKPLSRLTNLRDVYLTGVADGSQLTEIMKLRSLIDFLTKSPLNPLPNLNLQQNIVDAEAKSCPNLAQTLCVLIKSWPHLPANNKAVIMALLSIDK